MGRGRARAVCLLLGVILAASLGPTVIADRVIVEDEQRQGRLSVVHVVVDPPAVAQTVDIVVTVDGPAGERQLTPRQGVSGDAGKQLVTVSWTPAHVGEHTLRAEAVLGDETRVVGERDVHVASAPSGAGSQLPDTAPGTVQWAIAFGILFFVARAGFGHRSP